MNDELQKQQAVAEDTATAITVTDEQSYAVAQGFVDSWGGLAAKIKAYFKPRKDTAKVPYQREIDDEKAMLAPVEAARKVVKAKQSDWRLAEEAQARLEQAALMAEAKKAGVDPSMVTVAAPEVKSGKGTRKMWKFRITDESLIPHGYMIPDEKAIGALVKLKKDKTDIPGVEVYAYYS